MIIIGQTGIFFAKCPIKVHVQCFHISTYCLIVATTAQFVMFSFKVTSSQDKKTEFEKIIGHKSVYHDQTTQCVNRSCHGDQSLTTRPSIQPLEFLAKHQSVHNYREYSKVYVLLGTRVTWDNFFYHFPVVRPTSSAVCTFE